MPQILKKEIKNKILQSALNSFLEKGYRNTSMQEIAQNAGIAAGNIYNYFKNKEEVFSTLIYPVLTRVKEIFAIQSKDLPMLNTEDRMGIAQRRMEEFIQVYQSNRKVFVLLFEKATLRNLRRLKRMWRIALPRRLSTRKTILRRTPQPRNSKC